MFCSSPRDNFLWPGSRQTENKEFSEINQISTNCVKTQISVPTNTTHLLNTLFGSSQLTHYYIREMPDLPKHVSYLVRVPQDT